MATFGRRVQPKHRASPADRRRATPPVPRPGAHADPAPTTPAPTTPAPATPAAPDRVDADPLAPPRAAEGQAVPEPEVRTAPEAPGGTEPTDVDGGPLRVLVVDDNEDVRGLLRIAFARADIDVVGAAGDSREALAIVEQDPPGIILLDVNLPVVAGLDLLPQLRERCPRARVVMFSAQCGSQVTQTAAARGAVGFVEKGVPMKKVVAHLREVARAPHAEVVEPFPLRVYP